VLYYRTAQGIKGLAANRAVASDTASIDALVEQVLAKTGAGDTVRLDLNGRRVLAARIKHTGWFLVLFRTPA